MPLQLIRSLIIPGISVAIVGSLSPISLLHPPVIAQDDAESMRVIPSHSKSRLDDKLLAQTPQLDVPYFSTPPTVIDEMLRLANLKQDDVLYDLGSGDGRIVIAAAQKYGVRGVGIELDPQRIQEANENARRAGVSDRVRFIQQDLFQADFSQATVVTIYLLPSINLKLRPKLLRELKPGTRVISHAFDMGKWRPEEVVELEGRSIYYWVIPQVVPENLKNDPKH
jgi:hypothetical protein